MDFITQSIVIGLTEQAPLVLAAIGFALLYRLTGLINVAYAETVTLSSSSMGTSRLSAAHVTARYITPVSK